MRYTQGTKIYRYIQGNESQHWNREEKHHGETSDKKRRNYFVLVSTSSSLSYSTRAYKVFSFRMFINSWIHLFVKGRLFCVYKCRWKINCISKVNVNVSWYWRWLCVFWCIYTERIHMDSSLHVKKKPKIML